MRHIVVSTLVIAALSAPLAAQPNQQRQAPEPPPLPSLPAQPAAAGEPQRVTIPFSDPSRPGKVELDIVMGSITVKGTNRKDVQIEGRPASGAAPRPRRRRPDDDPP